MAMKAPENATTPTPAKTESRHLRLVDPFDFIEQMQQEFTRFWGQPLFGRSLTSLRPADAASIWMPRVDVYEADGNLVIHAELPGVKKEDIRLTVDNGDLVIDGERKREEKVEEKNYYRIERMTGSFYRRLPLPSDAKQDKIKAEFKDGVLEVRVPRDSQARTGQKIAIN